MHLQIIISSIFLQSNGLGLYSTQSSSSSKYINTFSGQVTERRPDDGHNTMPLQRADQRKEARDAATRL